MPEVKRSLIAHYLNTTPSATNPTWSLLGLGVSSAQMAMNPQSETTQYVHEDNASTSVTGYQPVLPVNQKLYPGDEVFDFVDAIRQAGPSIGGNDLTQVVEVRLYETPTTTDTYPATKWNVQVQIDNAPGGDAGVNAELAFTLNIKGDPTDGDFNTSGLSFT